MRSDVDDPVAFDHDLMIGEKLQLVILARKHPVGLDYQACRCLKFPGSGCRPLALWSEEGLRAAGAAPERGAGPRGRSEEHTSELQSLMRISYAGFCLKKKNTHTK